MYHIQKPADVEDSPADSGTSASSAEQSMRELQEKYRRIQADFENYKERTSREMERLAKTANEELIKEILPFVDNLERAIKYAGLKKNDLSWAFTAGIRLAIQDILKMLGKYGLAPITAIGEPFDPRLHDAVSTVDSASHPPGTVIDEVRKGYLFDGRVLRPSRVVVALAPGSGEGHEPEPA
ncbi:MAG: nucleotide exchange factor GrpE [Acidobacteria bacterium]|nr:nucleotide exchange factor GrpE [Acidobacteriota bacterium]